MASCLASRPWPWRRRRRRGHSDPVHTRVLFAVEHAGFSHALGTVSGSTGTLVFDRDDWTSARLDVQVPLQRLDLGDEKWNKAVLASNLSTPGITRRRISFPPGSSRSMPTMPGYAAS